MSEIRNNPKVCVYYADHVSAKGYVSITGTATVIDDKDLLMKMKRDYWERYNKLAGYFCADKNRTKNHGGDQL